MTSQIFANIYLNEFDRLIKHNLKPQAYLRYGDDFIIVDSQIDTLKSKKLTATKFLSNSLKLQIHPQRNVIIKPKQGLKFLGVKMWPNGRSLSTRNRNRVKNVRIFGMHQAITA